MCYLTRTVPFARVVSIASDFVYRLVVKAFLVLATVLRNLRHRVTGKGSVVRCVYGKAEAVQRLCRVEGEENFESATAAVVGGPVYCGDGDGVVRKIS